MMITKNTNSRNENTEHINQKNDEEKKPKNLYQSSIQFQKD